MAQHSRITLDEIDTKLLQALQEDAQVPALDLAERLHLSASQISRRKARLEASGLIRHYTARLNAKALGLTVQAFVQVQLGQHSAETSQTFARLIDRQAEITAAWTMTGEADYLLRVFTEDLEGLNSLIHDTLLRHPAVARVQSQIVMDQLKADAPLPVRT